jgi:hypothetical protein
VLTSIDTARWFPDVWGGGGFPTTFNFVAEHPPGSKLYADLYGLSVSTNEGETWTPYPNRPSLWQTRFLALNPTNTVLYSTGVSCLISFDLTSGRVDTLLAIDLYNVKADMVVFGDTLLVAIGRSTGTGNRGIYRSTNGGDTWAHVLESANVFRFGRPSSRTSLFAGGDGVLFKSDDAGVSWTVYNNSLPATRVTDILVTTGDTLIVATQHSGVLKVLSPFTVDVDESPNARPAEFKLNQNFPNPFNPSTRIVYRVGRSEFVELSVFDVLGREVETLVQEMKQPGEYEATWDAGGKSSGVYFYSLTAGGSTQIRKMILLR